jgi:hypothetical protein
MVPEVRRDGVAMGGCGTAERRAKDESCLGGCVKFCLRGALGGGGTVLATGSCPPLSSVMRP